MLLNFLSLFFVTEEKKNLGLDLMFGLSLFAVLSGKAVYFLVSLNLVNLSLVHLSFVSLKLVNLNLVSLKLVNLSLAN